MQLALPYKKKARAVKAATDATSYAPFIPLHKRTQLQARQSTCERTYTQAIAALAVSRRLVGGRARGHVRSAARNAPSRRARSGSRPAPTHARNGHISMAHLITSTLCLFPSACTDFARQPPPMRASAGISPRRKQVASPQRRFPMHPKIRGLLASRDRTPPAGQPLPLALFHALAPARPLPMPLTRASSARSHLSPARSHLSSAMPSTRASSARSHLTRHEWRCAPWCAGAATRAACARAQDAAETAWP